jgi:carotenoid cleavage dioxygenase-like enzyme
MPQAGSAGQSDHVATTEMPPRPAAVVPGTHLTGPFAPVTAEIDIADLPVEGALPADLDGAYVRNGPNPRFTPLGSYVYPLDGDGKLHRVTVEGGRARYDNRAGHGRRATS